MSHTLEIDKHCFQLRGIRGRQRGTSDKDDPVPGSGYVVNSRTDLKLGRTKTIYGCLCYSHLASDSLEIWPHK